MSFKKYTNYSSNSKGRTISVRFKKGIMYLSAGFIDKATRVLREDGALEEGEEVRYVELWFDVETIDL